MVHSAHTETSAMASLCHQPELFKTEIIGEGSYGYVVKAVYDDQPCAAKMLHPILLDCCPSSSDRNHRHPVSRFETECDIMSRIKHPNIVQYLGVHQDPETGVTALFMEHMDQSLTHYLEASVESIPREIQSRIIHDVAKGMSFLHSQEVIHRDLTSNNVLLTRDYTAKVIDFGMAKVVGSHKSSASLTKCPGSPGYMPPEAFDDTGEHTVSMDVFSLGVLMIQTLTRAYPTPGSRFESKQINDPQIPSGKVLIPIPEFQRRQNHISQIDPSHPILPIALQCIKNAVEERPSASEVCTYLSQTCPGLEREEDMGRYSGVSLLKQNPEDSSNFLSCTKLERQTPKRASRQGIRRSRSVSVSRRTKPPLRRSRSVSFSRHLAQSSQRTPRESVQGGTRQANFHPQFRTTPVTSSVLPIIQTQDHLTSDAVEQPTSGIKLSSICSSQRSAPDRNEHDTSSHIQRSEPREASGVTTSKFSKFVTKLKKAGKDLKKTGTGVKLHCTEAYAGLKKSGTEVYADLKKTCTDVMQRVYYTSDATSKSDPCVDTRQTVAKTKHTTNQPWSERSIDQHMFEGKRGTQSSKESPMFTREADPPSSVFDSSTHSAHANDPHETPVYPKLNKGHHLQSGIQIASENPEELCESIDTEPHDDGIRSGHLKVSKLIESVPVSSQHTKDDTDMLICPHPMPIAKDPEHLRTISPVSVEMSSTSQTSLFCQSGIAEVADFRSLSRERSSHLTPNHTSQSDSIPTCAKTESCDQIIECDNTDSPDVSHYDQAISCLALPTIRPTDSTTRKPLDTPVTDQPPPSKDCDGTSSSSTIVLEASHNKAVSFSTVSPSDSCTDIQMKHGGLTQLPPVPHVQTGQSHCKNLSDGYDSSPFNNRCLSDAEDGNCSHEDEDESKKCLVPRPLSNETVLQLHEEFPRRIESHLWNHGCQALPSTSRNSIMPLASCSSWFEVRCSGVFTYRERFHNRETVATAKTVMISRKPDSRPNGRSDNDQHFEVHLKMTSCKDRILFQANFGIFCRDSNTVILTEVVIRVQLTSSGIASLLPNRDHNKWNPSNSRFTLTLLPNIPLSRRRLAYEIQQSKHVNKSLVSGIFQRTLVPVHLETQSNMKSRCEMKHLPTSSKPDPTSLGTPHGKCHTLVIFRGSKEVRSTGLDKSYTAVFPQKLSKDVYIRASQVLICILSRFSGRCRDKPTSSPIRVKLTGGTDKLLGSCNSHIGSLCVAGGSGGDRDREDKEEKKPKPPFILISEEEDSEEDEESTTTDTRSNERNTFCEDKVWLKGVHLSECLLFSSSDTSTDNQMKHGGLTQLPPVPHVQTGQSHCTNLSDGYDSSSFNNRCLSDVEDGNCPHEDEDEGKKCLVPRPVSNETGLQLHEEFPLRIESHLWNHGCQALPPTSRNSIMPLASCSSWFEVRCSGVFTYRERFHNRETVAIAKTVMISRKPDSQPNRRSDNDQHLKPGKMTSCKDRILFQATFGIFCCFSNTVILTEVVIRVQLTSSDIASLLPNRDHNKWNPLNSGFTLTLLPNIPLSRRRLAYEIQQSKHVNKSLMSGIFQRTLVSVHLETQSNMRSRCEMKNLHTSSKPDPNSSGTPHGKWHTLVIPIHFRGSKEVRSTGLVKSYTAMFQQKLSKDVYMRASQVLICILSRFSGQCRDKPTSRVKLTGGTDKLLGSCNSHVGSLCVAGGSGGDRDREDKEDKKPKPPFILISEEEDSEEDQESTTTDTRSNEQNKFFSSPCVSQRSTSDGGITSRAQRGELKEAPTSTTSILIPLKGEANLDPCISLKSITVPVLSPTMSDYSYAHFSMHSLRKQTKPQTLPDLCWGKIRQKEKQFCLVNHSSKELSSAAYMCVLTEQLLKYVPLTLCLEKILVYSFSAVPNIRRLLEMSCSVYTFTAAPSSAVFIQLLMMVLNRKVGPNVRPDKGNFSSDSVNTTQHSSYENKVPHLKAEIYILRDTLPLTVPHSGVNSSCEINYPPTSSITYPTTSVTFPMMWYFNNPTIILIMSKAELTILSQHCLVEMTASSRTLLNLPCCLAMFQRKLFKDVYVRIICPVMSQDQVTSSPVGTQLTESTKKLLRACSSHKTGAQSSHCECLQDEHNEQLVKLGNHNCCASAKGHLSCNKDSPSNTDQGLTQDNVSTSDLGNDHVCGAVADGVEQFQSKPDPQLLKATNNNTFSHARPQSSKTKSKTEMVPCANQRVVYFMYTKPHHVTVLFNAIVENSSLSFPITQYARSTAKHQLPKMEEFHEQSLRNTNSLSTYPSYSNEQLPLYSKVALKLEWNGPFCQLHVAEVVISGHWKDNALQSFVRVELSELLILVMGINDQPFLRYAFLPASRLALPEALNDQKAPATFPLQSPLVPLCVPSVNVRHENKETQCKANKVHFSGSKTKIRGSDDSVAGGIYHDQGLPYPDGRTDTLFPSGTPTCIQFNVRPSAQKRDYLQLLQKPGPDSLNCSMAATSKHRETDSDAIHTHRKTCRCSRFGEKTRNFKYKPVVPSLHETTQSHCVTPEDDTEVALFRGEESREDDSQENETISETNSASTTVESIVIEDPQKLSTACVFSCSELLSDAIEGQPEYNQQQEIALAMPPTSSFPSETSTNEHSLEMATPTHECALVNNKQQTLVLNPTSKGNFHQNEPHKIWITDKPEKLQLADACKPFVKTMEGTPPSSLATLGAGGSVLVGAKPRPPERLTAESKPCLPLPVQHFPGMSPETDDGRGTSTAPLQYYASDELLDEEFRDRSYDSERGSRDGSHDSGGVRDRSHSNSLTPAILCHDEHPVPSSYIATDTNNLGIQSPAITQGLLNRVTSL